MTVGRAALRAAQGAILGLDSGASGVNSLCAPCLKILPVTGVSVSTLSGPVNHDTVCATDDLAHTIDELQFDLGEGPSWEAFASRRPVLVPDLRHHTHPKWPVFGQAVQGTAARAIFGFPLYVGWTGIGALGLYSTNPGPLAQTVVEDALALAATIAAELMNRILRSNSEVDDEEPWREWPQDRRRIHQATGMLIDQLDLPVGAAFARLRGHAFAHGIKVTDVAREVVAGTLVFRPDAR